MANKSHKISFVIDKMSKNGDKAHFKPNGYPVGLNDNLWADTALLNQLHTGDIQQCEWTITLAPKQ